MNNKEVAHLWANQSRASAKGSSFYFEGDTIYSYGSHFPIARHFKGVILFTSKSYSVTTAKHKSITWGACHHLPIFHVSQPANDPSGKDVKEYGAEIDTLALKASRARNPDFALQCLTKKIEEANRFCETFGFKTRFSLPDEKTLAELKARAKASAERERKAKAARQARQEREAAGTVQKWLAGESVTIPHYIAKTYLRSRHAACESINGNEPDSLVLETSRGARVPLEEAHKAFRFALIYRVRGWHRNGEQFKVGDYQLDAVNEQGVIAGCHRIDWEEIERFAKVQGWI